MSNARVHRAPNTKIKVIMGNMLNVMDYKQLSSMDNLNDFTTYLARNTHYAAAIPVDCDYDSIELKIKEHMLAYFDKLYYYYIDEYREFFLSVMMRYQVENIKLCLRAVVRGEDSSTVYKQRIHFKTYPLIDCNRLDNVDDVGEFIDRLADTKYHDVLKRYTNEDPSKMLFYMEMALDRLYFEQVYESMIKLDKRDRNLNLELYGINVDLLNIQWIYRGRKYFGISAEELFNFTLNNGFRYNYKQLKEFCYMELDSFKLIISQGAYKSMFEGQEFLTERNMEHYLFNLLDEYGRRGSGTILVFIVFMFKMEYEMRDLFTIMEGIQYKIPGIAQFLVRDLERRN